MMSNKDLLITAILYGVVILGLASMVLALMEAL